MELTALRRLVISALFTDDVLFQHLVLKGGNALELVYDLISRGSVDVDFSISGQFDDVDDIQRRIFAALRTAFGNEGLVLFDERFKVVPPIIGPDPMPWWGGYTAEFKLIESGKRMELNGDLANLQRQSMPIDPRQGRRFRIDISKHEYCQGKVAADLGGQTVYVYSEEMCVFEKYRSICQQMPEYQRAVGRSGGARGQDFYDIYTTLTRRAIDIALPENLELCRGIFAAKRVPLQLLKRIESTREFHRPAWDAVKEAVTGNVFEFDFYFDFIVSEAKKLQPLWIE